MLLKNFKNLFTCMPHIDLNTNEDSVTSVVVDMHDITWYRKALLYMP